MRFTPACMMLVVLLGGCNTPQERAQKLAVAQAAVDAKDDRTCQGYGVRPGSDPYVKCRMQLAQNREAVSAQRAAAISAAGANMGAAMQRAGATIAQPPPPYVPTNATPVLPVCSTQPSGNGVVTSCQ
jgi:hypothetical protein